MVISFDNADNAFTYYYHQLLKYGKEDEVNKTKVLYNICFDLKHPQLNRITNAQRAWKQHYAEREWKWYQTGDRSVEDIKKFAPIWDKMHNGDNLVWSNYGYWWKRNNQLEKIKELLRKEPYTRRAVLVHYDVDELDNYSNDTPCNLVLNFYFKFGELNLTIFARSIDIWYGYCNDQYIFSKLLMETALDLEMNIGTMTYMITNLHLYYEQLNKNK